MIKSPQNSKKDSHCTWCGAEFTEKVAWPRKCFICYNESYKNPIPVVVAMIRVFDQPHSQCGWLVEQRGIEPKKGEWAFPGGFVEYGEDWKDALVRELQEEIGLITSPSDFELFDILNVATTGNMLIFGAHKFGVRSEIVEKNFVPNHEVMAIEYPILPQHRTLCFPTHNEAWVKYYDSHNY
jgi:8-oxo-dGTP diphosphatase